MSIHKIGSDLVRPLPQREGGLAGKKSSAEGPSPGGRPERADRVGFSEEGLALAAQGHIGTEELSPQRLDALRERIAGGFYDAPAVAEEVARRILASGDMELPS